jgi:hypothetical protein
MLVICHVLLRRRCGRISPLRSCGMAEKPELKAGRQSRTKGYSARTKRHTSHWISRTLHGTGSCAAPCRMPNGSSPGVAGFFTEDLIDDHLVDLYVEERWASLWSLCSRLSHDPMLIGHRLPGDPGVFLRLSFLCWLAGLMGSGSGLTSSFAVSIPS